MNSMMLAMAMSGGGASAGTLKAMQRMRTRNYEKLCSFIKFLTGNVVFLYYWLKKHPAVVLQDAAGKPTSTPDYTGQGTQAFVEAFWTQLNQKDFFANLVQTSANMLMEWLKPDEHEFGMWESLLKNPSPAAALPDLITSQQSTLQTLIQQLQQSVPASSAAIPTQAGPLPPGWTADQYFQKYGFWPTATVAPQPGKRLAGV